MKFTKAIALICIALGSMLIGFAAGAQGTDSTIVSHMSPGYFEVETCAQSGSMPIIWWSGKGVIIEYELENIGACRLATPYRVMGYGMYCTGTGELDDEEFIPDKCISLNAPLFIPGVTK